ncbi:hypothetical protein K8R42_04605 [bacterium]|nr:hypothetical protein [bacterium]
MALDINKITEQYDLSEDEKKIMSDSGTANTAAMNQSRIVSEFILGKKIDLAVDKIVASNKELSKANDNHSRAMRWLTGALVFVGIMQLFF